MYILNYQAVLYHKMGVSVREDIVLIIFCQGLLSVDSLAVLFYFSCIFNIFMLYYIAIWVWIYART